MLRTRIIFACLLVVGAASAGLLTQFAAPSRASAAFNQNNLIDDSVFNAVGSMNAGQIDAFLNTYSASCISSNNGFQAIDPTGYNPTDGFIYGGYVSAGTVIAHAAQAYNMNPRVLITTLQKEQSLVEGGAGCSTARYTAATGYGCPDGGSSYNYSGLHLYKLNGQEFTSISGTCVNSALKAGFTQQVIRTAWALKFYQQRALGNINWAVVQGSWDNSDDLQSCYGGPMTQGTWKVCPGGTATFYDGYRTIDGVAVHMDSGATAALYYYTPHSSGNKSFVSNFERYFGSTHMANLPGCAAATNTTLVCVWRLQAPVSGKQVLVTSLAERDNLVMNEGYIFVGNAFLGNLSSAPQTGNIPVYRLKDSGGGTFLTTDQGERSGLIAGGYTDMGIDFYADPAWSNSGYNVYRLYSASSGQHIWTGSGSERNKLLSEGYADEGIAFTSLSQVRREQAAAQGKQLVYRFGDMPGNSHFWTTDLYERDSMIKAGYRYEGVAWYSSSSPTSVPLYRLYAATLQEHIWTTDAHEKDVLSSTGVWKYEGISQYMSSTPTQVPIYRLYSPITTKHHWTTDAYEKSVLVGNRTFVYEGVAWYQP